MSGGYVWTLMPAIPDSVFAEGDDHYQPANTCTIGLFRAICAYIRYV
jgi:hypothetical protein